MVISFTQRAFLIFLFFVATQSSFAAQCACDTRFHPCRHDFDNLHRFAKNGDLSSVKRLFQKYKTVDGHDWYLLNCRGFENRTALHEAVINNQLAVVKYLVGIGAALNLVDVHVRTPLHYAAISNNKSAAEYLIDGGANRTIETKDRKIAKDLATDKSLQRALTPYVSSFDE